MFCRSSYIELVSRSQIPLTSTSKYLPSNLCATAVLSEAPMNLHLLKCTYYIYNSGNYYYDSSVFFSLFILNSKHAHGRKKKEIKSATTSCVGLCRAFLNLSLLCYVDDVVWWSSKLFYTYQRVVFPEKPHTVPPFCSIQTAVRCVMRIEVTNI